MTNENKQIIAFNDFILNSFFQYSENQTSSLLKHLLKIVYKLKPADNMVLDSIDQSYLFFKSKLIGSNSEEVWVAALDSGCRLISSAMLFKGTVNYCLFHPRDILRFAIIHNAVFIIMAHNHPSGECRPSSSDYKNTTDLVRLCDLLQIPLVDHLIITEYDCYSFKLNRLL